jgi:hypothetical protein
MLGIHTAFRDDSDFSSAEAVFGSQLVLSGQDIDTAKSPNEMRCSRGGCDVAEVDEM